MPNPIIKAISLMFIGGYCISCATLGPINMVQQSQILTEDIWVDKPDAGESKAIIILLHGLNLKPQKMDDWAKILNARGATVIRLALYGHLGLTGGMDKVNADLWREQFKRAMTMAQELSLTQKVPIYFVGFSLGALVALEWLAASESLKEPTLSKMILIAPAIATVWYSETAVNMLSVFGETFSLPSRSPAEYRANKKSSIAAYKALFELKKSLEKKHFRNSNIPTLVLIDRHDELVPSSAIQKIIAQQKLGAWILEIVDNRVAYESYGFRHLMVDEASMGKELWDALKTKVLTHLEL